MRPITGLHTSCHQDTRQSLRTQAHKPVETVSRPLHAAALENGKRDDARGIADGAGTPRWRAAFLPTPPPPPTGSESEADGLNEYEKRINDAVHTPHHAQPSAAGMTSGEYEHSHVIELETAVQAWRRRAMRAAIHTVEEAHQSERDLGAFASSKWESGSPDQRQVILQSTDAQRRRREETSENDTHEEVARQKRETVEEPTMNSVRPSTCGHDGSFDEPPVEARAVALETDNARLRLESATHARATAALQRTLEATSDQAHALQEELNAAEASIDELERAYVAPHVSAPSVSVHPAAARHLDVARTEPPSPPRVRACIGQDEDIRALARTTCTMANRCCALQQVCAALVRSFSAQGSRDASRVGCSPSNTDEHIFAGLDCRPSEALVAFARTEAEERSEHDQELEAGAEGEVGASEPFHNHPVMPLLLQQWDRLQRSLHVSLEAVRASERVHRNREHALRALESVCAKQRDELHEAAAVRREAAQLEALVAEQGARLEKLRRVKGELSESNAVLRHQLAARRLAEKQTPATARARELPGDESARLHESADAEAAHVEPLDVGDHVSAPQQRQPQQEEAGEGESKTHSSSQPTSVDRMTNRVTAKRTHTLRVLQTPALSHAPLSVVDAVYTAALDLAESPSHTPSKLTMMRDRQDGGAIGGTSLSRRVSPGRVAQRVAAVSTATKLGCDDHEVCDLDEELIDPAVGDAAAHLVSPFVALQPSSSSHPLQTTCSQANARHRRNAPSVEGPLGSESGPALVRSIHHRARRWEVDHVRMDSRQPYAQTWREEEDGGVRSTSASPSPTGRGAFDSWQDRFRAVMEASLDDL